MIILVGPNRAVPGLLRERFITARITKEIWFKKWFLIQPAMKRFDASSSSFRRSSANVSVVGRLNRIRYSDEPTVSASASTIALIWAPRAREHSSLIVYCMDVLSSQEHPPFQCSREPHKMEFHTNPLMVIIGLLLEKSIFFIGFFCAFTEVNATIDLAPGKKFIFNRFYIS
jgi:hypothetical protein